VVRSFLFKQIQEVRKGVNHEENFRFDFIVDTGNRIVSL
jgi:hypothetical protein